MFNEERFYEGYKGVRNRFRKFDSLLLVSDILSCINAPAKDSLEMTQRHPWLCLLVVKWIVIDDDFGSYGKRRPRREDTLRVLNHAYGLSDFARLPSDYDSVELWMRATVSIQMQYQQRVSSPHFFRQWLLFADQNPESWIAKTFKHRVGISISNFLFLGYCVVVEFLVTDHTSVKKNFFANLSKTQPKENVEAFWNRMSWTVNQMRAELQQSESRERTSKELLEQSPFLKRPFIRTMSGESFAAVSVHTFYRCIEHFVYDELRRADAGMFMLKFGEPIFERYVEKCIRQSGLQYVSANEIQKNLKDNERSADFIISESNANIYIDAKGVEMANRGRSSHLAKVVRESVKKSVLGAVEQTNHTKSYVENGRIEGIQAKPESFAIVVTYKELYLYNGKVFYEKIAGEKIDRILASENIEDPIPQENVFFFSIDNFDLLLGLVESERTSIAEALAKFREADSDPSTSKFHLHMHLSSEFKKLPNPSWLQNKMDEIHEDCKTAINGTPKN